MPLYDDNDQVSEFTVRNDQVEVVVSVRYTHEVGWILEENPDPDFVLAAPIAEAARDLFNTIVTGFRY